MVDTVDGLTSSRPLVARAHTAEDSDPLKHGFTARFGEKGNQNQMFSNLYTESPRTSEDLSGGPVNSCKPPETESPCKFNLRGENLQGGSGSLWAEFYTFDFTRHGLLVLIIGNTTQGDDTHGKNGRLEANTGQRKT
ncbi:hypothetical protein RRG08_028961 [Elysia crispata]|uniref:Uncharacterized protein n=1 Tax=Elysia crispata TaxID=231223 RepID=A0AAE1AQ19_9GAST|nr:hypothetical protein RRG08_028961 [Elysia crispata]